ncbi:Faf1p ASCRUDRAFT_77962 [Ascoidea rubescens DSM 1968]|uniref:Uncharacterized protein n=1 Tax=Ascoidea rubescens DSM 1968 TaxID=1344418 RepID=A0A1D2V992_9ASCO|nr:hypothetical protein ASCRUDRAFT_77962 [Ascoidea rubescens DSM 1968]ODV58256.1 hypothetical protein ASCRUDRAFT_77962 [Ascoidea rubescens DSM 1968]
MTKEDKEYLRLLEIQRKNFEAQFEPVDFGFKNNDSSHTESLSSNDESSDEQDNTTDDNSFLSDSIESEDEEFKGFDDVVPEKSIQKQQYKPVVVKFNDNQNRTIVSKEDKKLSKLGRIPDINTINKQKTIKSINKLEESIKSEDVNEMENLKNDVQLQKLLSESHILSSGILSNTYSGVDVTLKTINENFHDGQPVGKLKLKAMHQKLSNLSEDSSRKKLDKVPMKIRKEMKKKQIQRIQNHESMAKEGGIVLAKNKKYELRDLDLSNSSKITLKSDKIGKYTLGKKQLKEKNKVRSRGLKINSLGKFTKNGLQLSKKDIDRIYGR